MLNAWPNPIAWINSWAAVPSISKLFVQTCVWTGFWGYDHILAHPAYSVKHLISSSAVTKFTIISGWLLKNNTPGLITSKDTFHVPPNFLSSADSHIFIPSWTEPTYLIAVS